MVSFVIFVVACNTGLAESEILVALEMVENVKVRIPFTLEISVGFT